MENGKKEDAEELPEDNDDLDKALEDSFPASDPPAPVVKGTTANARPHEKKERDGNQFF